MGRIVHYVGELSVSGSGLRPGPCRAAIVTNVIEDREDAYVDLTIFDPNGQLTTGAIPFDAQGERAESWHWPERAS